MGVVDSAHIPESDLDVINYCSEICRCCRHYRCGRCSILVVAVIAVIVELAITLDTWLLLLHWNPIIVRFG